LIFLSLRKSAYIEIKKPLFKDVVIDQEKAQQLMMTQAISHIVETLLSPG